MYKSFNSGHFHLSIRSLRLLACHGKDGTENILQRMSDKCSGGGII